MDNYFQTCVYNMKEAIYELPNKDKQYLLNFKPDENHGYYMDQNSRYNKIKDILSIKTDSDGHSGASFSVCLRGAIQEIKQFEDYDIIKADEIQEEEQKNMITLEPLSHKVK